MSRKITVALIWTPDIDGAVDLKGAYKEVEKVFPEKFDFHFIGTNGIIDDRRNAHEILRSGNLYMKRGEWTINSSDAVSSFSAFCNNRISRSDFFCIYWTANGYRKGRILRISLQQHCTGNLSRCQHHL
ncbi:MAG: hypothetical protein K5837_02035 [Candidatus Saccharibacteria bacterium]|nr:hypothetical protein [Candidatus Saccharibacteria bacterium]